MKMDVLMMMLKKVMFLMTFLSMGYVVADPIADLQKALSGVDIAITQADDAWIAAFVQIKIFDEIINSFDAASPAVQEARVSRQALQAQIDQQSPVLNDLYEKRLQLASVLNVFQKALSENTSGALAAATEKINSYKKQYVDTLAECSNLLRLIQDLLTQSQARLASSNEVLTEESKTALQNVFEQLTTKQADFNSKFNLINSLSEQLKTDFEGLRSAAPTVANEFAAWLTEQKPVFLELQKSYDSRVVYINQLKAQFDQKKQQAATASAVTSSADNIDVSVEEQKKVLKQSVQEKLALCLELNNQLSGMIWAILSDIPKVNGAINQIVDVGGLSSVVAQADALTEKIASMGVLEQKFKTLLEELEKNLMTMQTLFKANEIEGDQVSFRRQQAWSAQFSGNITVLKDQFSMVRTRLQQKKMELAAAQEEKKSALTATQLLELLSQMRVESASVIQDILTPLVMGISQKIMGLADYFSVETQTDKSLSELRIALDEVKVDFNAINNGVSEYLVWSQAFENSVKDADLIVADQDQAFKNNIVALKKSFEESNIWCKAVSSRQDTINKTLTASEMRYDSLVNKNKIASKTLDQLNILQQDLLEGADFVDTKFTAAQVDYEKLKIALEKATTTEVINAFLEDFKALLTAIVEIEAELKKQQDSTASTLSLANQSGVVGDYQKNLQSLQARTGQQITKIQQFRRDFTALNQQALAKRKQVAGVESTSSAPVNEAQAASVVVSPVADGLLAEVTAAPELTKEPVVTQSLPSLTGSAQAAQPAQVAQSSDEQLISLVVGVKKTVEAFEAVKQFVVASAPILERITTDDEYAKATSRVAEVKKQLAAYTAAFDKLGQDVDVLQKQIEADRAAGRNIATATVDGVSAAKVAIAAVKNELQNQKNIFNQQLAGYQKISDEFSKKASQLSVVKNQASVVSQRIQQVSSYLERIKSAIIKAQGVLTSGGAGLDLEQASLELAGVEKLRDTVVSEKKDVLMPELEKLKKEIVPKFVQAYGALPDSLAQAIDKQGLWVDAVDSSVATFMNTIAGLKSQLAAKRDAASQDTLSSLGAMTFSQQLRSIENQLREVNQPAQVEILMKQIEYVMNNRYGDKPEDKNKDMIVENRNKLRLLLDLIIKHRRFAQKKSILEEYRTKL
jgi:hypothetical protein